jgi:trk system potassium uptake protein TrkA
VYVIVVGGGRVGYYLTRELLAAGHEVALMEKDPRRARQISDEVGSIVLNRDGCEGKYLEEAGANRAAIVAAVTGGDEDNLVVCQMAKHHFDVPRTRARVKNPRNESLFRHLGVDDIISPTRMALAAIEQDIPVHELLHLAQLHGANLELLEAQIDADSPAVGRRPSDLALPDGGALFVLIRGETAQTIRPDTVFQPGDNVIAIARAESERELRRLLIGAEAEETSGT